MPEADFFNVCIYYCFSSSLLQENSRRNVHGALNTDKALPCKVYKVRTRLQLVLMRLLGAVNGTVLFVWLSSSR